MIPEIDIWRAISNALHSHTSAAVEASVDEASGEIRVDHIWAAVDAALACLIF